MESEMPSGKRYIIREHLDRRLVMQLRLFCAIFLVISGLIIVAVIRQTIEIKFAFGGILTGLVIGIVLSRMHHLTWDEQAAKVVGQIDWIGGVILTLYIVFLLGRDWLFGHWVQAGFLMTLGLCLSAGTMFGRVFGVRHGILKILEALALVKPRGEGRRPD
jgi:hypothetical protein